MTRGINGNLRKFQTNRSLTYKECHEIDDVIVEIFYIARKKRKKQEYTYKNIFKNDADNWKLQENSVMSTLLIFRLLCRVIIKGKIAENEKEPDKSRHNEVFNEKEHFPVIYANIRRHF